MKYKISLSILIFLFFHLISESQTIKKMDDATWNAIDAVVQNTYTSNLLKGVSVAIVYGGNIAYANAFGDKNGSGDPFTIHTKSLLASVSKTITGVLCMRMVQNGDLALDDTISHFITGYNNSGITIRHLLDHQSGIAHYSDCPGGYGGAFNANASFFVVHNCSLCVTPPGSGTLYTTFGNTLLGIIIDKVGRDVYNKGYVDLYDEWMHDPGDLNTLEPAFDNSDPNLAEGSEGSGYWNDIGWKLPAGGFISDIVDLANYTRGLLNNVFITHIEFETMMTAQNTSGTPNHTCGDLSNTQYGLAFIPDGNIADLNFRVTHDGENTDHGFYSHISIYPNHNAAIVILTNTGNAGQAISDIFNGIEDLVLCPPNRNFTNTISWTEPRVFEGENITGQSIITSNSSSEFNFDANNWVKLLPGFQAPAGKVFRALVTDGCGGTLLTD